MPITFLSLWALEEGIAWPGGASGNSSSGASTAFAFQLMAILNGISVFGRWLPGYVADAIGRFNTITLTMLLCLFALLAFWTPAVVLDLSSAAEEKIVLAVLFAVIFGFASGSNISLTPVCVGELCDVEEYGRYYATCYTVVSVGCLTGVPIAGGILSSAGGRYEGLVAFTVVCYAVGTVCFAGVRVRRGGWRWRVKS